MPWEIFTFWKALNKFEFPELVSVHRMASILQNGPANCTIAKETKHVAK